MEQTMRRQWHLRGALAGGLAAALILGACSGGDASPGAATADVTNDAAPGDESEDAPATVAVDELAAEDGWLPLHDFDLPGPGSVTLTVDGERVDLQVVCTQPGPVEGWDGHLFVFSFSASGETADGRRVTLDARRDLLMPEPPEAKFYDYLGQEGVTFRLTTYIDDGHGSAVRVSPSDGDSAGALLPVLHVSADGGFTVDEEIGLIPMSNEDALHGHIQVAGQCQEGWPEVLS